MRKLHVTLAASLLLAGCEAQPKVAPTHETTPPAGNAKVEKPATATDAKSQSHTAVVLPGIGSCQPSQQVETTAVRLIEYADADGDGQIERDEAESFMNFLVGGFFFRADADGDGTVTADEGRRAREAFASQHPALATLLQQAKAVGKKTGQAVFSELGEMLDVNYPKAVTRNDVRSAAKGALDDLYTVVDHDKDGTITLAEARKASVQGSEAIGREVFRTADSNADGSIALTELQAAVNSSLKSAFAVADKDNNQKLTEQEAQAALSNVASHLGFPMGAKL